MQIPDIQIKKMSEEDLRELSMLESVCFSSPWSEKGLFDELSNPFARFFVAKDSQGRVLGYIGSVFVAGEADITNIAVFPQCRNKGVGSALMAKLIAVSKNENIMQINLEVRKSNAAAISLYKKFGFETVGERKDFYTKPCEDAVLMTYRNKLD